MVTASDSGTVPPTDEEEATRFVPLHLQVGDVIGNYRIVRLLGRGGSGAIYEAHNLHNDGERAALKIVQPDIADRAMFFDLLRAEANALQEVKHDAVVQFRTFGRIEGSGEFYLVIEFVEGPTLGQAMREKPLSPGDLRRLAVRLANGLDAAHAQGVIHRDLSPDNVILPDGEVDRATLIDFSVARIGAYDPVAGTFAGKLSYAAPEQFSGGTAAMGPWTDLYSLGLVLAAAARGRKLDMGTDIASAVEKRLTVPSLEELPEELRGPIAALLEPDPTRRVQSATEAAALFLSPAAPTRAVDAPPAAPSEGPPGQAQSLAAEPRGAGGRWLWIAAGALILAGLAAAALLVWRPDTPELVAVPAENTGPSAPPEPQPLPAREPDQTKGEPAPAAPTPIAPAPVEAPVEAAPAVSAPPSLDPRLEETIETATAAAATATDAAAKADAMAAKAGEAAQRGQRAAVQAVESAIAAQEASDRACGIDPPADHSCAEQADGSHYGGEAACTSADCSKADLGVGSLAGDPRVFAGLWKAEAFISGCSIVDGVYEFCGSWQNYAPGGFGTLSAADGGVMAGQFEEGVLAGPGEVDLSAVPDAQSVLLSGENVSSGALTGYGVIAWRSGDVSSGKWGESLALEQGVLASASGTQVASVRVEGSPATGRVSYKDGRFYLGEYVDEGGLIRRAGLGVLYDANGTIIQQGRWQDDALVSDFATR